MSPASKPTLARAYRASGHRDAFNFALLIGLTKDYQRDPKAKKDVIDPAGDAHSIKSGKKRWQIFLYSRSRLAEDDGFQTLDGIGPLLVKCIDAFPSEYHEYERDETAAKHRLQIPMRELCGRLQSRTLLRGFLRKAFFNGGEVQYLTVCENHTNYHVYWHDDVINIMAKEFEVVNSRANQPEPRQFDDQKVLFKYGGFNVGELEMRKDSATSHYRELLFNFNKQRCLSMFEDAHLPSDAWQSDNIVLHGEARKHFGKW